jgi:hypothetical protein
MKNKSITFFYLTHEFYNKYKNCKEILYKPKKPYAVHLIEYNNLIFAIPIRSNITHEFSYKTIKEKNKSKGLDFTKTVIINDLKYLSKQPVRINQEEYLKLDKNRHFIEKKMFSYLKIYKKALQKPNTNKNKNILSKSTLQYFHKELSILFNEDNID